MIAGIFHEGSGLGDQLFRYITARTLALDKGLEFGMINPLNFKGKDFMSLDMGKQISVLTQEKEGIKKMFQEKKIIQNEVDIRSYDPEINFVEDNTIIDGNFEDIKYWGHRKEWINQWVRVEPIIPDSYVCIINFRGGEYSVIPELFLPKEYWQTAMELMLKEYSTMKFEVHTDDMKLAADFFPGIPIIQNIQKNWQAIRYANFLILSNSAFGILPALLNGNVKKVIAPRYWARRNTKVWARPSCYYSKFTYI